MHVDNNLTDNNLTENKHRLWRKQEYKRVCHLFPVLFFLIAISTTNFSTLPHFLRTTFPPAWCLAHANTSHPPFLNHPCLQNHQKKLPLSTLSPMTSHELHELDPKDTSPLSESHIVAIQSEDSSSYDSPNFNDSSVKTKKGKKNKKDKKEEKTHEPKVSYLQLYRFATPWDWTCVL